MKNKIIAFFISLVVTVISFLLIVFIEDKIFNPEGTTKVYVVKQEKLEKGFVITEKNFDELFKEEERRTDQIPKVYIENKEDVYEYILKQDIYENEVVTADKFENKDDNFKELSEKREVTVNASALENVVGGVLRAGDKVDILVTKNSSSKQLVTEVALSEVYISKIQSSDGSTIDRLDKNKSGVLLTFTVDILQAQELETAKAEGKLTFIKIVD
ncbi:MAG: hypothetical protein E7214_02425 [Clostridium sp.]|nr:hypothetical protein [Clostridium sp.]